MIQSKADLKEYLEADKMALGRIKPYPSFNDIIWKYEILLRKCEFYHNTYSLFGKIKGAWYKYRRVKIGQKCNFSIPLNVVGKGLCIAHIGPIVISNYASIGENCRIHICVNIGADARNGTVAPHIGNNLYIGPGAKIFGDIEIADNIAIGANSVVNKSFKQKGVSIAGVPAKVINNKGICGILK